MYSIDPEDFKSLKYNVYEVQQKDEASKRRTGTDLLTAFPKLKAMPSFANYPHGDRNYIIRYIIYLYDPGSPLRAEIEDYAKRQVEAALLAGFEQNTKGEFKSDRIKQVLAGDCTEVTDMIVDFLIQLDNRAYAQLVAGEQTFYNNIRALMKRGNYDDDTKELKSIEVKEKITDFNEKLDTSIKVLTTRIFGEDESLDERRKSRDLSPEAFANRK